MMIGGACVFPSMTKGEIVGRLVVVIDVNPCRKNTHGWKVYIMFFMVVGGTSCGSSWLRINQFLKMKK
jgi:hypothetical protein